MNKTTFLLSAYNKGLLQAPSPAPAATHTKHTQATTLNKYNIAEFFNSAETRQALNLSPTISVTHLTRLGLQAFRLKGQHSRGLFWKKKDVFLLANARRSLEEPPAAHITAAEACSILHCSRSHLTTLVQRGIIQQHTCILRFEDNFRRKVSFFQKQQILNLSNKT